ncbi:MAG: c-type cytochrome [Polaromonas sp.]
MKTWRKLALGACVLAAAGAAWVWLMNGRDEVDVSAPFAHASGDAQVERGAYLARAGNCMGCHTARGGANYAGGLGIATPFGTVYSSNLTPDERTGLGSWSPAYFWRALHNGRSKSGRLLYPAFPYTSYTQVTRQDSDALFAYLRSLPAVVQPNRPNSLGFPFNTQAALAVWRALYFSPGVYQPQASRSAEWNRGAYLVQGLGHCAACHSPRDALGGPRRGLDLAGGLIAMQNWYAPSLASPHEAGVGEWKREDIVSLLKNGVAYGESGASVSGPMAEVVLRSTQHLSESDLDAMAQYLQSLPAGKADAVASATGPDPSSVPFDAPKAAKLYEQHCAQCHGEQGQGVPKAYPALAGNRAVTLAATENLVQMVLAGGYPPATAGNPRPFGMPPFVLVLDDSEIAAVITHLRTSWGNQASPVTPMQVQRMRGRQAP